MGGRFFSVYEGRVAREAGEGQAAGNGSGTYLGSFQSLYSSMVDVSAWVEKRGSSQAGLVSNVHKLYLSPPNCRLSQSVKTLTAHQ